MILTLVKPSIKITAMSRTEDTIPSIDVMESHESGKNTAGTNLEKVCQSCALRERAKLDVHNQTKNFIKVSRIHGCDRFC